MPVEQLAKVHDDLTELKVGVTELLTNQKHVMAGDAEMKVAMKDFVPRSEIKDKHDALVDRIASLEEDRRKIVWSLIGTIGAGISFAATRSGSSPATRRCRGSRPHMIGRR